MRLAQDNCWMNLVPLTGAGFFLALGHRRIYKKQALINGCGYGMNMNHLFAHGAPPPPIPSAESTIAILRWMVAVMDDDDKSMGFIAGCLSHCWKNDGLTDRQAAGCHKVFIRLTDAFEHLQLDCQGAYNG